MSKERIGLNVWIEFDKAGLGECDVLEENLERIIKQALNDDEDGYKNLEVRADDSRLITYT